VIVKHAEHQGIRNERNLLLPFQDHAPYLRSLIDEVDDVDGTNWSAIVLKHLHDDLLASSSTRTMSRPELKKVGKGVLEALQVLHSEGYIHTGGYYRTMFQD
jgi:hypothetical protein